MAWEMNATSSGADQSSSAVVEEPEGHIFRKYYTDRDYLLSPEGLLKLLSAIVCVVSSVLLVSAAGPRAQCPRAPALAGGAPGLALLCGAGAALSYAAVGLGLPLYAPQTFLFADIILSTVMGVLLLIMAVFSMMVCEFASAVSYMHGPLGVMSAGTVTASAVITYIAVMRLWDAARPSVEPPPPPPTEQDV